MFYTITKDMKPYLRTDDALLAINLYSQLRQSGATCALLYGKRVFADSSSQTSSKHGK